MELTNTYEDFKALNDQYIEYNMKLMESNFTSASDEEIIDKLTQDKILFETMKVKSDLIEVTEENRKDVLDLKYLIVDGLFLSIDLLNFYKLNEIERFKMRIVNYVRKQRVTEMFK